jgi:hypothetical protein
VEKGKWKAVAGGRCGAGLEIEEGFLTAGTPFGMTGGWRIGMKFGMRGDLRSG